MLPRRRLVRPAADDDFVICRNVPYGQVLMLPSRRLVCPTADDDFIKQLVSGIFYQYLQIFFLNFVYL